MKSPSAVRLRTFEAAEADKNAKRIIRRGPGHQMMIPRGDDDEFPSSSRRREQEAALVTVM